MEAPDRRALPRPVKLVGVLLAAILGVGFFLYLGFPYERVRERLAAEASRQSGARVTIESLAPRLSRHGPLLEVAGVRASRGGGEVFHVERVALRPALSRAWLRADPAFRGWIESSLGAADADFTLGGHLRARLRGVPLEDLPAGSAWPGASLGGRLDGTLEVTPESDATRVALRGEAEDGSVYAPEIGLAIPFETLDAELRLAAQNRVEIEAFTLTGPMLKASVQGRVGPAPDPARAPLDLTLTLDAEPAIRDALARAGIPLGRDGTLRVSGTLGSPRVR